MSRLAPRTIQARIALLTFLLLAGVLGVVAVSVDHEVGVAALRALDNHLKSEAEALATLAHFDGKRVELEFEDEIMTAFSSPEQGAYFQVSTAAGVIERSRSLRGGRLPPPEPSFLAPLPTIRDRRCRWATLHVAPLGPLRERTLAITRGAYTSEKDEEERPESAPRVTIVVQVARSLSEVEEARASARRALALAIPLALVLGTAGAFLVARRATAPIARLSRQASEVGAGSVDRRLDLGAVDGELQDLASTLNAAFDRLSAAIERERRFSTDVAHELRTPLTIARTSIEVALLRERTPAEYQAALEASLQATSRLEAIVAALLTLARAESAGLKRAPLDLRAVVAGAVSSLQPEARQANVAIKVSLPEKPATVVGNATLLERLVANLVENAIRYGASPDGIEVSLSEAHGIALAVRDRGPGLPEGFFARAFERFSRAEESRDRASGGAGLGLSIVRAIARAHGAEPVARPREGGGAEVVVVLPRAEA